MKSILHCVVLCTKLENLIRDKINTNRLFLGTSEYPQQNHNKGYIEIDTGVKYKSSAFFTVELFCYHYGANTNFNMSLSVYCFNANPTALAGLYEGSGTPDARLYQADNGDVIIRVYLGNTYYASVEAFLKAHMGVNHGRVLEYRTISIVNGDLPIDNYRRFVFVNS